MTKTIKRKAELAISDKRHKCAACGFVIYRNTQCVQRPKHQNPRARTVEYVHIPCASGAERQELVDYGELTLNVEGLTYFPYADRD